MDEMERYIFEDHVFDEIVDYLKKNDVSDLIGLVGDAVSYVECENNRKEAKTHGDISEIVDYCMNNTIPDGTGRRKILFREIAIWMVENGMNGDEMKKMDEKITSNCPGRKKGEIVGWIDWVARHKPKQNIKSLVWFVNRVNSGDK